MESSKTSEGLTVYYRDDYFGAPWHEKDAEVVVLVHGIADSSRVWYVWIHALAAKYRVITFDVPGYGRSVVPADMPHDWSTQRLSSDIAQVIDALGLKKFHLIGAKYGGSIVVQYAGDHPSRIRSLSIIAGPVRMPVRGKIDLTYPEQIEQIVTEGVRPWAEATMGNRLGSSVTPEHKAWWTELMGSSDPRATRHSVEKASVLDLMDKLPQITAPTLFLTTSGNNLIDRQSAQDWVDALPDGRIAVIEGDSYHPSSTHPKQCLEVVLAHLRNART